MSVSPVFRVCSVVMEVGMLVLLSSSLMPVLLESRQITSCLTDFTSCCDAADADDTDTCFVTSPGGRNKRVKKKRGKTKGDRKLGMNDGQEGKDRQHQPIPKQAVFMAFGISNLGCDTC